MSQDLGVPSAVQLCFCQPRHAGASLTRIFRLSLLAAAIVGGPAISAASADAAGEARIHRPTGEYRHLWLTFESGEKPIQALVALRDGQASTVWFVGGAVPGGRAVAGNSLLLVDSHPLALDQEALAGTIGVRQVTVWAPMKLHAEVRIAIEAKRTGATIAGHWSAVANGDKKSSGTVTGTITDEQTLRQQQAFDPNIAWPSYHGAFGTNRAAASRTELVDDLNEARPVWKSEQPLLTGWGNGVDDRYPHRAAFGTVCGGAGSPIFADGRIYLFHYRPAGEPQPQKLAAALERFEKENRREPSPVERDALADYARAQADTIVVCLDACTGGVVWRATFPRMSGNYQTHKWRGFNPTAARVGPAIIANDHANNWVALDAEAGTVLWTIPRGTQVTKDSAALGAVAAGGLAILPGLGNDPSLAVEPATGRVVWKEAGGQQAHVFGSPGQERVVFLGGPRGPLCRDAATGKELWKMPEPVVGSSASAGLIDGVMLVAHVLDPDATKRGGHFRGWRLSDAGATAIWEDAFLPFDENLTVTINAGKAYLVGGDIIRVLDLATGEKVAERTFDPRAGIDAGSIGSNQWLGIVGDRLFLSPEGQHGRQALEMLRADTLESIGKRWHPPNNTTTAYGRMSIAFPVIDGRVIVRGSDGLYLYDLRKQRPR
jgi:outer membrane protein assembly factor BamB